MKKPLGLIVFALLLFGYVFSASAQENATQSAPPQVDSYVLFWPLSAGKTEGESLYPVKLLKESVRSWFIFDGSKKAEYQVLLGTKRVLEAEKLIKENKSGEAKKTLKRSSNNLTKAYDFAKIAADKGKFDARKIRKDRLINIKALVESLKADALSDLTADINTVKGKADRLLSDYLP